MKKYGIVKNAFIIFLIAVFVCIIPKDVTANDDEVIYYFYVTGCSSCAEVEKEIESLPQELLNRVAIYKINTADLKNQEILHTYFEAYNIPEDKQIVPIIFAGGQYLSGKKEIVANLRNVLLSEDLHSTKNLINGIPDDAIAVRFSTYKLLTSLGIGFVNGLNPCSLSILILFMSLIAMKSKNILKIGITYSISKLITYLLLGTIAYGILKKFDLLMFSFYVNLIFAIVFFGLAIFYFIDFLSARSEKYQKLRMQLPKPISMANTKFLKIWAARINNRNIIIITLLIGAVTSLLEFLCTGQIYLATIVYTINSGTEQSSIAVLYLLFYCIAFVIPYLIITLMLYKGKSVFEASDILSGKLPVIKLITACVFVAFGILMLVI